MAALQCVEQGLFSLDENVTRILPEFKDKDILTGMGEDGKPILIKSSKTITLRFVTPKSDHEVVLNEYALLQSSPHAFQWRVI